jgi:hypothetical protein
MIWRAASAVKSITYGRVLYSAAMRFPILLALIASACASGPARPVPQSWMHVEEARKITQGIPRVAPSSPVHLVQAQGGEKLVNGDKDVTPVYRAIDSFDYMAERHEVIFSAKRDRSFDIGLAADDGSEIHWVPEDPADEVAVQWAPRGNKVTFLVPGKVGTIMRTVHIPTSTQLTVDFPFASIRSFAYDAEGQRVSVVYSTPDASERLESLQYGGEERRMDVAPAVRLNVTVDRRGDAVLLTPIGIRYNEKLPLVVWMSSDPLAWDDARASLMRNARVACAVVSREPDAALWTSLRELAWVDGARMYLVGDAAASHPATIIRPAAGLSGVYEQRANIVTAPAGIVESFAAGFIAEQLKGTSPPDGYHR